MARVTYCIPSYNHAPFVKDTIKSVIDQTHSDIELIVIDDGSSDSSVELISETIAHCETRFSRFEFIHRSNRGLTATLNEAVEWAQGKYFSTIASDDQLLPDKTAILIDLLEKDRRIAGAFGGYIEIDADGQIGRSRSPAPGKWGFEDVLAKRCQLFAPTAIVRTEAVRKVGGYWEDIAIEDWAMWLKLTHEGYRLQTVAKPVAYYRRHIGNSTGNTEKMLNARLAILDRFDQGPKIDAARAKAYYGAVLVFAQSDKALSRYYFNLARRVSPGSIWSKPAFRALKRMLLSW